MHRLTPPLPQRSELYARYLKYPLEFIVALLIGIMLLPLLLLISLLLLLSLRGNPFFYQTRIGRGGKPFRIIKFRSMKNLTDSRGKPLPDEQRTTRIGAFLRHSSLDELPEIINVLKGDMALIGPRPWIPEHMLYFAPHTRERRMRIRPGISGLAQTTGRNSFTFRHRIAYDLHYQRHLSPALDLWIYLHTLGKVLRREDITQCSDAFPTTQHS